MIEVPLPSEERATAVGLTDTFGPDGETVPVSVRVLLNPLRLLRVIVAATVEPGETLRVGRLVLMLKSGIVTETATVVVFVDETLVPWTVAV